MASGRTLETRFLRAGSPEAGGQRHGDPMPVSFGALTETWPRDIRAWRISAEWRSFATLSPYRLGRASKRLAATASNSAGRCSCRASLAATAFSTASFICREKIRLQLATFTAASPESPDRAGEKPGPGSPRQHGRRSESQPRSRFPRTPATTATRRMAHTHGPKRKPMRCESPHPARLRRTACVAAVGSTPRGRLRSSWYADHLRRPSSGSSSKK